MGPSKYKFDNIILFLKIVQCLFTISGVKIKIFNMVSMDLYFGSLNFSPASSCTKHILFSTQQPQFAFFQFSEVENSHHILLSLPQIPFLFPCTGNIHSSLDLKYNFPKAASCELLHQSYSSLRSRLSLHSFSSQQLSWFQSYRHLNIYILYIWHIFLHLFWCIRNLVNNCLVNQLFTSRSTQF